MKKHYFHDNSFFFFFGLCLIPQRVDGSLEVLQGEDHGRAGVDGQSHPVVQVHVIQPEVVHLNRGNHLKVRSQRNSDPKVSKQEALHQLLKSMHQYFCEVFSKAVKGLFTYSVCEELCKTTII